MSKTWFISDPHFGHKSIIKLANRPFATVEEMDNTIINNINFKVKHDDILYCLGDFAHRVTVEKIIEYRKRINCHNIILIAGNHDRKILLDSSLYNLFTLVHPLGTLLQLNKKWVTCCHYPMLSWFRSRRGGIMLHGHSHEAKNNQKHRYNVCVENYNYEPITLEEILG